MALFFRAAFVHLTMLQSTPACTVLRPSFLVLLSIVAPHPPLYLHWHFSFCRLLVPSPLLSFLPVTSTRTIGPSFRTLRFLPPRYIHLPTTSVVHHPLVLGAADGRHNAQCIFVIKIYWRRLCSGASWRTKCAVRVRVCVRWRGWRIPVGSGRRDLRRTLVWMPGNSPVVSLRDLRIIFTSKAMHFVIYSFSEKIAQSWFFF